LKRTSKERLKSEIINDLTYVDDLYWHVTYLLKSPFQPCSAMILLMIMRFVFAMIETPPGGPFWFIWMRMRMWVGLCAPLIGSSDCLRRRELPCLSTFECRLLSGRSHRLMAYFRAEIGAIRLEPPGNQDNTHNNISTKWIFIRSLLGLFYTHSDTHKSSHTILLSYLFRHIHLNPYILKHFFKYLFNARMCIQLFCRSTIYNYNACSHFWKKKDKVLNIFCWVFL